MISGLLRKGASLKLATICLLLLALLTFFGTLDQVEHGLYQAQQQFFYSWLFRWYINIPWTNYRIWFPFPGGALVLFVFTINLVLGLIYRFRWTWRRIGLLLSHLGLLMLLLGGAWTHYNSTETTLTLEEGQSKSWGESSQNWELALWRVNSTDSQVVYARTLNVSNEGKSIDFTDSKLPIEIRVDSFFVNSIAYAAQPGIPEHQFVNSTDIALISPAAPEKEPQNNKPGVVFHVKGAGVERGVLLHAFDIEPTYVRLGGSLYAFQLRRERLWLPFEVKLLQFRRELHGGTSMASKYESKVEVEQKGFHPIQALIAMNQPLRKMGYIFYQASFSQGSQGSEASTLSVVQNRWRLLPYISSLMMGLGLILHFLLRIRPAKTSKKEMYGDL